MEALRPAAPGPRGGGVPPLPGGLPAARTEPGGRRPAAPPSTQAGPVRSVGSSAWAAGSPGTGAGGRRASRSPLQPTRRAIGARMKQGPGATGPGASLLTSRAPEQTGDAARGRPPAPRPRGGAAGHGGARRSARPRGARASPRPLPLVTFSGVWSSQGSSESRPRPRGWTFQAQ